MPVLISRGDVGGVEGIGGAGTRKYKVKYWQRHRKESKQPSQAIRSPPAGASLLTLPTEIRLSIFEYFLDNQKPITLFNGSDTVVLVNSTETDPEEADHKVHCSNRTSLLRACRQIHDEVEDAFFNRTLFGIIASPYEMPPNDYGIAGPKALPHGCIPLPTLSRIRKLLFVMDLRGPACARVGYRVGDLQYLQAMTALKEIRIVLTAASHAPVQAFEMAPIRAIIESVPASVCVRIGPQSLENAKSESQEEGIDSPSQTAASERTNVGSALYAHVQQYVNTISERRGILSGSTFDHGLCYFQHCMEGKGCVNSGMETPPKKQNAVLRLLNALKPKANPYSVLAVRRM